MTEIIYQTQTTALPRAPKQGKIFRQGVHDHFLRSVKSSRIPKFVYSPVRISSDMNAPKALEQEMNSKPPSPAKTMHDEDQDASLGIMKTPLRSATAHKQYDSPTASSLARKAAVSDKKIGLGRASPKQQSRAPNFVIQSRGASQRKMVSAVSQPLTSPRSRQIRKRDQSAVETHFGQVQLSESSQSPMQAGKKLDSSEDKTLDVGKPCSNNEIFAIPFPCKSRWVNEPRVPIPPLYHPRAKNYTGENVPAWISFSLASTVTPAPIPLNATLLMHKASKRRPKTWTDADQPFVALKKELARLANLLEDGSAEPGDLAHYILFSYTVPEFNPTEYGDTDSDSLHVIFPPVCRIDDLFYSLTCIDNNMLFDVAQFALSQLIRIIARTDYGDLLLAVLKYGDEMVSPSDAECISIFRASNKRATKPKLLSDHSATVQRFREQYSQSTASI